MFAAVAGSGSRRNILRQRSRAPSNTSIAISRSRRRRREREGQGLLPRAVPLARPLACLHLTPGRLPPLVLQAVTAGSAGKGDLRSDRESVVVSVRAARDGR